MRIIIVQSEIEEAIKAYINNQVDIKEGQTINIELKSTRGEDGATAEINISAAPAKKGNTRTQRAAETVQETRVVDDAPKEEKPSPEAPVAETVVNNEPEPASADPAPSNEPANEPVQATRPSGSLFAGLSRPNNEDK